MDSPSELNSDLVAARKDLATAAAALADLPDDRSGRGLPAELVERLQRGVADLEAQISPFEQDPATDPA